VFIELCLNDECEAAGIGININIIHIYYLSAGTCNEVDVNVEPRVVKDL
jgi:hypothetical protein